jgi:hypothetical protein
MLRRPEGATVAQIAEETGWALHTVRGFFAGLKKKGHAVEVMERVRQVGPNKEGARGVDKRRTRTSPKLDVPPGKRTKNHEVGSRSAPVGTPPDREFSQRNQSSAATSQRGPGSAPIHSYANPASDENSIG